jgi:hypothetical protein
VVAAVAKLAKNFSAIPLFKAVLDSHASEHGARMTAMDKATENAGDLLKALKLSYNQARMCWPCACRGHWNAATMCWFFSSSAGQVNYHQADFLRT